MKLDKLSVEMRQRRAQWRRIVEEAARSGRSIRAFCRERQVKEHLFYHWRSLLEREDLPDRKPGAKARFVLVSPRAEAVAASSGVLELEVERGWRLRIPAGTDAATLRAVLVALAGAR